MEALPNFTLLQPRTAAEAIALRQAHPGSRWLAGGTDLIPNLRRGLDEPVALIDLAAIEELQRITLVPDGSMRIGAGVILARIAADRSIGDAFPSLAAAAFSVGAPSHRELATLGGNLGLDTRCAYYNQALWWREGNGFCLKHRGTVCHVAPTGSRCHAAFSSDLAAALIALGAQVETAGPSGRRRMPLEELYADDGAAHLRIASDEVIVGVELRREEGLIDLYEKARQRDAIDFPLAGVAVALRRNGEVVGRIRVALTGTNSRPILLAGTEALEGWPLDSAAIETLEKLVQRQVSPMRTTTVAAHYRRRVAVALARRLAKRAFEAASAATPARPSQPVAAG